MQRKPPGPLTQRREVSTVSARTIKVGDTIGDWEVVEVLGRDGRYWRVRVRCVVCQHAKPVRVDNLRATTNRCLWEPGSPSPHVGRGRRCVQP